MTREIRRHHVEMSEIDRRRWEQALREVEEELPEIMERGRRLLEAAAEPTLSGGLRRAVRDSDFDFDEIVERLGIPADDYSDFQAGVRPLPSDVLDRLAAILGCELVPAASNGAAHGSPAHEKARGSCGPRASSTPKGI